jgi:hypothetical protein
MHKVDSKSSGHSNNISSDGKDNEKLISIMTKMITNDPVGMTKLIKTAAKLGDQHDIDFIINSMSPLDNIIPIPLDVKCRKSGTFDSQQVTQQRQRAYATIHIPMSAVSACCSIVE